MAETKENKSDKDSKVEWTEGKDGTRRAQIGQFSIEIRGGAFTIRCGGHRVADGHGNSIEGVLSAVTKRLKALAVSSVPCSGCGGLALAYRIEERTGLQRCVDKACEGRTPHEPA